MLLSIWLLAGLGIAPAEAASPPNLLPLRDVAVSYELSAPGRPATDYMLHYDAAGERARIDDPAHGSFFLVDVPAGRAQLVVPMLRTVVDAPDLSTLSRQVTNMRDARFTDLGPGRYAGLGCETYLVINGEGSADVCVTPDGVALHFNGRDAHGAATVTATSVVYGPQPAAAFAPPAGYGSITLPPGALQQLLRQQ